MHQSDASGFEGEAGRFLPFGSVANCPKCGAITRGASARYCLRDHWSLRNALGITLGSPPPQEHLDCTCTRCGYVWYEATRDATLRAEDSARHVAGGRAVRSHNIGGGYGRSEE